MRGAAAREQIPMTSAAISKCAGCGALQKARDARFCEYCGARFAEPESAAPARGAPADMQELLAQLRRDGRAERMLARIPASATTRHAAQRRGRTRGFALQLVVGLIVVLVLLKMAEAFRSLDDAPGFGPAAPGLFRHWPLVMLAFFLAVVGRSVWRGGRRASGPASIGSGLAGVSDKRTEVESEQRRTETRYYVTLELEGGARRELAADAELFARLRSGDVGAAWWSSGQPDELVEFERAPAAVEVPADAAR
ncbi:MAG: DUF2500 family protein [Planctomycetota bacterium]|nr:MAG: DUF2500 family protein [Planctomycetota bacterium]